VRKRLKALYGLTFPDKLLDPSNSNPGRPSALDISHIALILRASLNIRKVEMVTHQLFLVPWILHHPLIVFETLEHDLTEAVKFCHIDKMCVEDLRHKGACLRLVVDLCRQSTRLLPQAASDRLLTIVHRTMPYLVIRGFVSGADTLVM